MPTGITLKRHRLSGASSRYAMASFFCLPDSASNLSLASANKAAPKGSIC